MRIDVLTIFPEYLAPLELSLIGRARELGQLDIAVHDLRAHTRDRHRSVDDTPYGGGAGMVMSPEPWGVAVDALLGESPTEVPVFIVPTPSGERFDQEVAAELATEEHLVFGCGRYEGIDARVADHLRTRVRVRELSVGDYVLAGGEVAVLVMVEAVTRLVPGVLGNPDSLVEESHVGGVLEYPVYTKPATWRGLDVPPVLMSGDHARIATWRREHALRRTTRLRPDLIEALEAADLSPRDHEVLAELGWVVTDAGRIRPGPLAVAD